MYNGSEVWRDNFQTQKTTETEQGNNIGNVTETRPNAHHTTKPITSIITTINVGEYSPLLQRMN